MIVVAILAIIASIGVPQYVGALRTARVGKAKHELVTISQAVDAYTATSGKLPLSLHQVGYGGKRDPWGMPYCYLNYADGTGDGLDWAIEAGLVDPSAFSPLDGAGGGGDGGTGASLTQGPVLGAVPVAAKVRLDFDALEATLGRPISLAERVAMDQSVANNGGFSLFTGVTTETTRRRDQYLFPLNTDYDLFSLGADHQTASSLSESIGQDDVIRANNGGFFGLAGDY
jgi:general secretion pathway protein G